MVEIKFCYLAIVIALLQRAEADEIPRGHGQILGKHRDSEGHVPVLTELPTPQEFWDKYVSIRRPVVFRGPGKMFPAFEKWTDDYLIKNFGDLEVKLEHKTEKGKTPVGDRGVGRDTIRSYLETYKTKPSYIVSQLPDPMADDVAVPPFMMCGTIYERILESNLWLSAGGTKSMLHRDADHAINCLLNGTKDWILIDPKQEDKIPIAEGDAGYGGFAVLDVDKVNLIKYPKFTQVKWEYANMTPGDCLYLPCSYWHQVRSYGEKNLAVTVLFSRLKSFNGSDCSPEKLKYTPLSKTGMVWTYPGHGPQTLGNLDPFELREDFESRFRKREKLTYKTMKQFYNGAEDPNVENGEADELGRKLVEIFDLKKRGYLVKDDITYASVDQLKAAANAMDPDPANTDYYEYYMFEPEHVKKMFTKALDAKANVVRIEQFVKVWMKHGGSEKIARELFAMFEPTNNGQEITYDNLKQNAEKVFKLFNKRRRDDPSGDYYMSQLKEDKAMFGDKIGGEYVDDDEQPNEKEDNDDDGNDNDDGGGQADDEDDDEQKQQPDERNEEAGSEMNEKEATTSQRDEL